MLRFLEALYEAIVRLLTPSDDDFVDGLLSWFLDDRHDDHNESRY